MQTYKPVGLSSIIDVPRQYDTLKEFTGGFRVQYTCAMIDLAQWGYQTHDKTIETTLGDAHQNVTTLMRALDVKDRKFTYDLLQTDGILQKIQVNRLATPHQQKDIADILGNFDSPEGERVLHKAKTENYFGIREATETAKNLYVRRVYGELGGNSHDPREAKDALKLTAYALDVDVKTVRKHLEQYDEKIKSNNLITFSEWEQTIKKNPELIMFYQQQMKGVEQVAPALETIEVEKGQKPFKMQGKHARIVDLKELNPNEDFDEDDLEKIALAVGRLAA